MTAYDHRGRPVHAGKVTNDMIRRARNLPRLSRAVAGYLSDSAEEIRENAEDMYGMYGDTPDEEFAMKHSLPSFYGRGGDYHIGDGTDDTDPYPAVESEQAQEMLNNYRRARNAGEDVELAKGDIEEAIRNRGEYNY